MRCGHRSGGATVHCGACTQPTSEGPREPDVDKIRSLRTLRPGGRITAALASQISDGASAVLVCSERAVREHGLQTICEGGGQANVMIIERLGS